jgi:DNA-binding FadR family transcriptional regulator
MERVGLVSQVEAELEKMLALGLLPPDGKFPSEHGLARCFGVSRGTVREAIRSLTTRGLVVPYPGKRTRVVAWDQALNLETLSVALTGDGRLLPGRHELLEGFLALKREITVDLLVACCETASPADLDQLSQACFLLEDTARWDTGEGKWVWQEFDLLKQAACIAERMGHLLLIQSLERTFKGMAKWALPHLNAKAVQSWARCATLALDDKNVQALRHKLPPLLKAVTERLLQSITPPRQPPSPRDLSPTVEEQSPGRPTTPEAMKEGVSGPENPILSDSRAGSREVLPPGGSPPEFGSADTCHEPPTVEHEEDCASAPDRSWSADMQPTLMKALVPDRGQRGSPHWALKPLHDIKAESLDAEDPRTPASTTEHKPRGPATPSGLEA